MRFTNKRIISYVSNFMNITYLIRETILKFFIELLAHSSLLIILRYS